MSDNYTQCHYRRKTAISFGSSREKNYCNILLALFSIGMIGFAYLVFASGLLSEDPAGISKQLLSRINTERQANNLPSVFWSGELANLASADSARIKAAPLTYNSPWMTTSQTKEDFYIYPRLSWTLSSFSLESPLYNTWISNDKEFGLNTINPNLQEVGIDVSSDGYNYYIVTTWK